MKREGEGGGEREPGGDMGLRKVSLFCLVLFSDGRDFTMFKCGCGSSSSPPQDVHIINDMFIKCSFVHSFMS